MSTLSLGGLLSAYTTEPATGAHVNEVFDLTTAESEALFGFSPLTLEDVRADLEYPGSSLCRHWLVRDGRDGAPVQYWEVIQSLGDPTVGARIRSHPRLPEATGDELARVGWATMLDWIRAVSPTTENNVVVMSGCRAGDEAKQRRLEAAGFEHERTFWSMAGSLKLKLERRAAVHVAGLTIAPTRDERTVYQLLDEAFAGQWGYETLSFDDWLSLQKSQAGFDPALWRLAEVDGTPAAVMTMTRRVATRGRLYVADLATSAPFRRRGLASALLAHAFEVAAEEGYDWVELDVDSKNPDEAPSVYRRAGLDVEYANHIFRRTVSTGQRPAS